MYLKKKLKKLIESKKTLLGVGPMSKNCVDASIEVTDKYNFPIMLIASRRQIDANIFGKGYVENWGTEKFSKYVMSKSKKKNIILCRDHGGPYQNNNDIINKLTLKDAIKNSKKSFEIDIKNDFKIIHIDPSINLKGNLKKNLIMDNLYELMIYCDEISRKNNKKILIEIGTEEQSGTTNTFEEIEKFLNDVNLFCKKNKIIKPSFVVLQTGTKVQELENVGSFECPIRIENEIAPEIQIFKALELCDKYDFWMKEHNGDYLSDESLKWHPKIGIHATNVAPEFGVIETISLIKILKEYNMKKYLNLFLELSYNSKKWTKWLRKNSNADDFKKSIIAGHYIFSDKEFIELKKNIIEKLKKKSINLDLYLKQNIMKSILRYTKCFKLH